MNKTLIAISLSSIALVACTKPAPEATKNTANTEKVSTSTSTEPTSSSPTPAEHNAQNNLNWAGEYKGLLPCADCSGIKTELELKPDQSYELTEEYQGKGDGKETKTQGKFTFDASTNIVTLDERAEKRKFFVGDNFIEVRDITTGEKIEGSIAEHLKLTKDH